MNNEFNKKSSFRQSQNNIITKNQLYKNSSKFHRQFFWAKLKCIIHSKYIIKNYECWMYSKYINIHYKCSMFSKYINIHYKCIMYSKYININYKCIIYSIYIIILYIVFQRYIVFQVYNYKLKILVELTFSWERIFSYAYFL